MVAGRHRTWGWHAGRALPAQGRTRTTRALRTEFARRQNDAGRSRTGRGPGARCGHARTEIKNKWPIPEIQGDGHLQSLHGCLVTPFKGMDTSIAAASVDACRPPCCFPCCLPCRFRCCFPCCSPCRSPHRAVSQCRDGKHVGSAVSGVGAEYTRRASMPRLARVTKKAPA